MTSACTSLDAGFAFQLPRSLMPFVDATRDWIIKRIEPSAPKTFPPSYTSLEPLNPTVEMPHSTKGLDSEKLAYYTVQYDATSEVNRKILASIKAYRHPLGFEGDLVNAAWQIVDMGEIAWPALCNLAKSSMPELEYFLAPIFRIEGISPIV